MSPREWISLSPNCINWRRFGVSAEVLEKTPGVCCENLMKSMFGQHQKSRLKKLECWNVGIVSQIFPKSSLTSRPPIMIPPMIFPMIRIQKLHFWRSTSSNSSTLQRQMEEMDFWNFWGRFFFSPGLGRWKDFETLQFLERIYLKNWNQQTCWMDSFSAENLRAEKKVGRFGAFHWGVSGQFGDFGGKM